MSDNDLGSPVPPPEDRFADDARRYRLIGRIATGGMGEVWRAEDTVLGRTVAVKLLKHEYADDPTFRSRFASEARHAGSLNHPGIAGIFDFGENDAPDGPRPYLVMEYVAGEPLSHLLRPEAPMDPDVVRDLLAQAAQALGAAHARGIVHRDVKPANLLITPDRQVKVTDFGIARAADGVALTETGQVMGTPQYLSPEQARGETATAASDVYALAVVAYQCLVGRTPFRGDSPVTTALAHLREPVPELPDTVPEDLAAVVRTGLAKDPEDRFPEGTAFAAALRDPGSLAGSRTAVLPSAGAGVAGAAAGAPAAAGIAGNAGAAGATGAAQTPTSPLASQPATGTQEPADPRRRSGLPGWLPWVLVLLVLAALVWAVVQLTGSSGEPEEPAVPTETTTLTQSPEPTSEPSTEQPSEVPSSAETTPAETATQTPTASPTPTPTESATPTQTATPEETTPGPDGGTGGGG